MDGKQQQEVIAYTVLGAIAIAAMIYGWDFVATMLITMLVLAVLLT